MATRNQIQGPLWVVVAAVMLSGFAVGANAPAGPPEPSKEMRAKMATLHEQMATCLRSDKPVKDCRAEMMKSCQQLGNDQSCPMMGMGAHRRMMRAPASDVPKDK